MSILKIKDNVWDITLTYSSGSITVMDPVIQLLMQGLYELRAVVPITLVRLTPDAVIPNTFNYRIEIQDGRICRHKFQIVPPVNIIKMTFAMPDFWTLQEFAPHNLLEDAMVILLKENGLTNVVIN